MDPECDPEAFKLSENAPHYVVVDTNVALQQARDLPKLPHTSSGMS